MAMKWYALRSKPRKEEVLWMQLCIQKIEVFFPRLKAHPVNRRIRKPQPYFPGYLFVKVDIDKVGISRFKWMENSDGLVSFDDIPAPIPDHVISAIRMRVDESAVVGDGFFSGLRQGDRVHIKDGAFAGYEALFDERLRGSERVQVLLQMLSDRIVRIELKAAQIERVQCEAEQRKP